MILTVLGVKGGVGKSTVSMGLAIWLARLRRRVLLLDGDPRVRSIELKLRPRGKGSLFDILSGRLGWREAAHPCSKVGLPNLSVIPAGRVFFPPGADWLERLREAARRIDEVLAEVREEFQWMIIDTPPSVGYEHMLLTSMGERVLYVCEPNDDSIQSTQAAASDLARICGLKPAGVVLSKVLDPRDIRSWRRKASRIAPVLGVVPFDRAAERAFRRNMPVVIDAPKSSSSISLRRIAQRLLRLRAERASVEQRINLLLERLSF